MSLISLASIGADLAALAVLVGALYLPRHGRKDLLAAYIGINVGVLAVTLLLATSSVSAGLGLGLFGVLSIIRLRSTEISQHEIAYFFAALALGLLGGISASITVTGLLMSLVVASMWIGDHPALMRRNRHQVVMLDRAIADESTLIAHLEQLLGGTVRSLEVQRLDLVNDTTLVDVRYRLHRTRSTGLTDGAARAAAARPDSAALAAPAVEAGTRTAAQASTASRTQTGTQPHPQAPSWIAVPTPTSRRPQHAAMR